VHASWKQFIVGVFLGIAGWLIWYAGAHWMVAFLPLVLSLGLVSHAPFIMADGEHVPVPPPPSSPRSAWLLGIAQSILVGVGIGLVRPGVVRLISRAAPSIPFGLTPADLLRAALCVLWALGMIATFRRMRRRAHAG
jgi:hypothetical protein